MNINCITGGSDYLYKHIQNSLYRAKSIDIIVSFLMESGVKLLKDDLKEIQGVPIRILTGNYLNITQPSALYLLKELIGKNLDLRFYNDKSVSFHPKAYIFNYEDGGEIFIGSSNLSLSALTKGIEWNYRIDKNDNPQDFNYFKDQFEDMFNNNSIIVNDQELESYSKSWKKPKLPSGQYEKVTPHTNLYDDKRIVDLFEPRGAQIEALYNLKKTRLEGNKKGLVVAATGIGKTYLAAFDSRNFNRVLFIAHREEILLQAYESFKNVRTDKIITSQNREIIGNQDTYSKVAESQEYYRVREDYEINMGFFTGNRKDKNKDIIFASVQTLGKQEYLNENYFSPDYFDYIVVDEFHHAVTNNYQNILNYFKPKFLLGLTATPYRLDNRDVFSICDNNLVYEVDLNSAINKGWLVPFRYYGIYDDSIDYDGLTIRSGLYDEKELEKALSINKRADLVLKHYKRYKSKTAIGFCTSKNHASYMAKYFNERGINSVAVYSGGIDDYGAERKEAISKLKSGEIKIIFCVDMFNEGVDIKDIDLVMFLRPTESQTVFLQQLGRGLRISKNKKYLNVLDFIGNYKKAYLKPYFLAGKTEDEGGDLTDIMNDENYPEDCLVNFDFRIIDLFEYMKYGSQGKDPVEKEEVKLSFALRDEKVNFFSMVEGTDYLKHKYEIMLCKKQKLPVRPYLLDVKKSNSVFALSEKGKVYQNQVKDKDLPLKYISFIDSYIKVKLDKKLFENLYNNGLFATWIPAGPMKYFKGSKEGYITLLRIYELKSDIDERLLERGRRGRNSFFGLSEDVDLDIVRPILSDEEFNEIKSDMLNVIKESGVFIDIEENSYKLDL
ncbi:DEAD/DEAH box helicase family protein [Intestinibacter sp.]|uniref:DEAD/DEAH box helicase family protein n=1 Tax=Intestinibacter sp. TaxID=1965304 RepID=UPI002A91EDD9|nr:DEAD/DEAH box helicase family protein [Intestinibacter sp.]MDY5213043.1 DEAD/DEAH box helicase family protein [Intestinibacter sp.]